MAFTTTRGESGVDFIGTDGVDALFVINEPENNVVSGGTGVITIDAKAGNDNVDLTNESGVTGNAEVKLGEGNDILTMGGNAVNRLNRLVDSFVNGGPGNDDITTEGAVSTKLRGNEGDDDFFLNSNYTNVTINGNAGQDSVTLDNDITLSNSKILGGSGNDGQFDFSDAEILGVDSVIQGGKGLDTITIGDLTAGLSNFRVSGGADNDTINIDNRTDLATGVAYNGADGDDEITFGLVDNDADAVTKGGNGNDRINILANNTGDIEAFGEAGDDTFTLNGDADLTVTGGEGADVYNIGNADSTTFIFNSVSESAATLTGTTIGFDDFNDAVDNTTFDDVIDLSSGGTGEALVGNRLNDDAINLFSAAGVEQGDAFTDGEEFSSAATNFAELKADLDGNLEPSITNVGGNTNTGRISLQVVEVTGANITGLYAILNNTNTILDSGDMMFKMDSDTGAAAAVTGEIDELVLAIEAGF